MSKDYPWINEGGIDYVEVNNLVNPPNPANAGKVIGVGEDGKAALVEGESGGGLPEVTDADDGDVLTVVDGEWAKAEPLGGTVVLYTVDPADTDPATSNFDPNISWSKMGSLQAGLSLSEDGDALTYSELSEIFDSNRPMVIIHEESVRFYPSYSEHLIAEDALQILAYVTISEGGETFAYGLALQGGR